MGVAAIVVDYRAPTLERLVGELVEAGISQVVVVDNAALEAARREEATPSGEIIRIAAGRNLGYGAAINWAVSLCMFDSILLLNPDVSIGKEAIAALEATLSSAPDVAAVGPLTRTDSGSPYPSFRSFPSLFDAGLHAVFGQVWPSNPGTRRYRLEALAPRAASEVPWISGSCMMLSRSWFRRVGGFDPAYFMYLEDVDLCRRLHLAGGRVIYDPEAAIIHYGQLSSDRVRFRALLYHHRSLLRYGLRDSRSLPLGALVAAGVATRFAVAAARAIAPGGLLSRRGGSGESNW